MTRFLKQSALIMSAIFGLGACTSTDAEPEQSMTNTEVRTQQLGESTQPVWFSGEGAGLLPTYDERVVVHFYNRIRIAPQNWPFVDMMGNRLLLPAYPAAIYQPFMSEAGRWQAKHGIDTGCNCDDAAVGYNPMDPATSEQEKFVNATCCEMGIVDGIAKCTSPLVLCTDARATLRTDRWALLNQGAAAIEDEQIFTQMMPLPAGLDLVQGFINQNADGTAASLAGLAANATGRKTNAIGISMSEGSVTPPECIEGKENPCGDGGTCKEKDTDALVCSKETNPMCLGLCEGGEKNGDPCVLPEDIGTPEECKPENWPKVSQIAILTGSTIEPAPSLGDGVHYQMPEGTAFDDTPMDSVSYAVNYYERTGDPVGTPSEIKIVLKDTCHDLTAIPNNPNTADGNPAKFAGITYKADLPAVGGCIPYVFVAKDAAGFEYTYPEYGSLQAKIEGTRVVRNSDDLCPIWVPTRVDLSCASDADECENGEKRACYTGRAGTQDNGICKVGEETCTNGRWSGQCDGEVTPENVDVCGDNKDNDCNGAVDETCEDNPDMGGSPDMGGADMGGNPDMGNSQDMGVIVTPPDNTDDEDGGCGCRTVNTTPDTPAWPVLALGAFASLIFWRRRRDL